MAICRVEDRREEQECWEVAWKGCTYTVIYIYHFICGRKSEEVWDNRDKDGETNKSLVFSEQVFYPTKFLQIFFGISEISMNPLERSSSRQKLTLKFRQPKIPVQNQE